MSPPRNEAAPAADANGGRGPKAASGERRQKTSQPGGGQRTDGGKTIDLFEKNRRGEFFKIVLKTYEGIDLVDVRVWRKQRDGTLTPSKKGISLPLRHLERVLEALDTVLKDTNTQG